MLITLMDPISCNFQNLFGAFMSKYELHTVMLLVVIMYCFSLLFVFGSLRFYVIRFIFIG